MFKHPLLMSTISAISMGYGMASAPGDARPTSPNAAEPSKLEISQEESSLTEKTPTVLFAELNAAVINGDKHRVVFLLNNHTIDFLNLGEFKFILESAIKFNLRYYIQRLYEYENPHITKKMREDHLLNAYYFSATQRSIEIWAYLRDKVYKIDKYKSALDIIRSRALLLATEAGQCAQMEYILDEYQPKDTDTHFYFLRKGEKVEDYIKKTPVSHFSIQRAYEKVKDVPDSEALRLLMRLKEEGKIYFYEDYSNQAPIQPIIPNNTP